MLAAGRHASLLLRAPSPSLPGQNGGHLVETAQAWLWPQRCFAVTGGAHMRSQGSFSSAASPSSPPAPGEPDRSSPQPRGSSCQHVVKPECPRRPRAKKQRLDTLCRERFPHLAPAALHSWILQGKVLVQGQPVYKPGTPLPEDSNIQIIAEVAKYVCRAGVKLEAALEHFGVAVSDAVALDAGISTGGFTDCLLQHGARRVYGVDVGYGQVSERIRTDPRVCVMERTNLRLLPGLPEPVDLVTLDLSFISILAVLPAVCAVMKANASLLCLIKPQFEALREQVGEGGIVRDPKVHDEVLARVTSGVEQAGFECRGWTVSPIKGAEGNTEFLAYFQRTRQANNCKDEGC